MNEWKIATIILGILVLCLLGYQLYNQEKVIDIQGLQISETDLEKFMSVTEEDQAVTICDLESNVCRTVSWRVPE